jgi:hypothetical protein
MASLRVAGKFFMYPIAVAVSCGMLLGAGCGKPQPARITTTGPSCPYKLEVAANLAIGTDSICQVARVLVSRWVDSVAPTLGRDSALIANVDSILVTKTRVEPMESGTRETPNFLPPGGADSFLVFALRLPRFRADGSVYVSLSTGKAFYWLTHKAFDQ